MVEKPATRLPPGSVVDILDRDGQWVGRGFYNGHSRIALRVLTADPAEAIDDAFFARRHRTGPSPCAATGSASTPSATPIAWSIPRATG